MHNAKLIKVRIVADLDQALVDEAAAIIEDLASDPYTQQARDDVLEWRPLEERGKRMA